MSVSPQRVLFLIPNLACGGAERVFSILLRHLDRNRFELHLAVLQSTGDYLREIPPDVQVHQLQVPRVRYALPAVGRLARRLQPDVLLSTLGHLNVALAAGRLLLPRKTRLLIREATVASVFITQETNYPTAWRWLYRHVYARADRIICPSEAVLHDLEQSCGVPREKLVRIYNPVELERISSLATAENPYRGSGPHLVSAGRLSKEKGVDILLQAWPLVLQELPQARLTVLGEGPQSRELRDLCRSLGLDSSVHFAGFQQNPWKYLGNAVALVLPSRYEGNSNTLLEALALGTRAVATDCPGSIREIADLFGGVRLVAPEDPRAFAEGIIAACRGSDRDEAPTSLPQAFTLEEVVSQYTQVLLSEAEIRTSSLQAQAQARASKMQ